jgi:uncharacterized protein (DUF1778 family)
MKTTFLSKDGLMATTIAGFVRNAAKETAPTLLEQDSRVLLSNRDFQAFNETINGAFVPNSKLQKALKSAARVKRA